MIVSYTNDFTKVTVFLDEIALKEKTLLSAGFRKHYTVYF